ncbi:MAG: formylglycine-generating enzyme family protein [Kiritimatiellae bacterium]|nr:formylglycine-generating enzyme family protein [Kiritimatiellia bacterium]
MKAWRESWQMFVAVCACTLAVSADGAEIRNVRAVQRYPWNGKVDLSYEVVGEFPEDTDRVFHVQATDKDSGTAYTASASALSGETGIAEGTHRVVWDLDAQGIDLHSTNVVFTVVYALPLPLYLVIDLSGGASAASYPVSELLDVPSGGWTDEYKTTKLVLRRIPAGMFTMGQRSTDVPGWSDVGLHEVTISKPFYIGVFEVTQRQYELVTGSKPSFFNNASYYATRPVEKVSYSMIRGSSSGAGWPGSSAVDASSFIGKLRTKTSIGEFDLPTEAQWEYACRAGTTTSLNSGKNLTSSNSDSAMDEVGRYWYNGGQNYSQSCSTSAGTAKVGSYRPNAWGLYDMHGNVWEWCLDWYASYAITMAAAVDPVGSSSGSDRVVRGGGWSSNAYDCVSSDRHLSSPSSGLNNGGFRLVRTLPNQ